MHTPSWWSDGKKIEQGVVKGRDRVHLDLGPSSLARRG